jgi:hypothetical protein
MRVRPTFTPAQTSLRRSSVKKLEPTKRTKKVQADWRDLPSFCPPITIGCEVYRVVIDNEMPEYGLCESDLNVIRIRTMYTERKIQRPIAQRRVMNTLVHELLHAVWDAHAIDWAIQDAFKITPTEWGKFEERVMNRMLTPAIVAAFLSAGWLPPPSWLPELPTGAAHRTDPHVVPVVKRRRKSSPNRG